MLHVPFRKTFGSGSKKMTLRELNLSAFVYTNVDFDGSMNILILFTLMRYLCFTYLALLSLRSSEGRGDGRLRSR